jgi:hypothetical protein
LVEPSYIFGYRGDIKNNLFLLDDQQRIIFPAAHNIVDVSFESKDSKRLMNIRPGLRQTQNITTMTLSDNKHWLAYSLE